MRGPTPPLAFEAVSVISDGPRMARGLGGQKPGGTHRTCRRWDIGPWGPTRNPAGATLVEENKMSRECGSEKKFKKMVLEKKKAKKHQLSRFPVVAEGGKGRGTKNKTRKPRQAMVATKGDKKNRGFFCQPRE